MERIEFQVRETPEYTFVEFILPQAIEPSVLTNLRPPTVNSRRGVILSGRGPIWLYCYLVHYYHPTLYVATYDPRLGGAVVVESHTPNVREGDVIPIPL